jgi:hypothetical protein
VKRPEKPGRHIGVVEQAKRDGCTHRRMLTFAKLTPDLLPPIDVPTPPYAEPPLLPHRAARGCDLGETNEFATGYELRAHLAFTTNIAIRGLARARRRAHSRTLSEPNLRPGVCLVQRRTISAIERRRPRAGERKAPSFSPRRDAGGAAASFVPPEKKERPQCSSDHLPRPSPLPSRSPSPC